MQIFVRCDEMQPDARTYMYSIIYNIKIIKLKSYEVENDIF